MPTPDPVRSPSPAPEAAHPSTPLHPSPSTPTPAASPGRTPTPAPLPSGKNPALASVSASAGPPAIAPQYKAAGPAPGGNLLYRLPRIRDAYVRDPKPRRRNPHPQRVVIAVTSPQKSHSASTGLPFLYPGTPVDPFRITNSRSKFPTALNPVVVNPFSTTSQPFRSSGSR